MYVFFALQGIFTIKEHAFPRAQPPLLLLMEVAVNAPPIANLAHLLLFVIYAASTLL